jgi:4-hydroxy-2-oxoheptanedioate aldolase
MKPIRPALATEAPQLGFCASYPAPGIVERIGIDWDWIWVDGQHSDQSYQDTLAIVRACDLVRRPAMVRVPSHAFGGIGRALDMGAAGVMVPLVDTPEEAKAVVRAAKFPPLGGRSYGGRRPIDSLGRLYSDTANEDTLLICQIESPEAVANADAIAAVPGVDALFLGPDDVLLRRGFKMNTPRDKNALGKDLQAVINACRRHGKIGVAIGIGNEMLRLCVTMGYQMIVAGGDAPWLTQTSKRISSEAREIIEDHAASAKPLVELVAASSSY